MKPVNFNESNTVFAADQDEYGDLPAFKSDDGIVVSCWKLNFWERLALLFTGRVWVYLLTFNKPLQPQYLTVANPFMEEELEDE